MSFSFFPVAGDPDPDFCTQYSSNVVVCSVFKSDLTPFTADLITVNWLIEAAFYLQN